MTSLAAPQKPLNPLAPFMGTPNPNNPGQTTRHIDGFGAGVNADTSQAANDADAAWKTATAGTYNPDEVDYGQLSGFLNQNGIPKSTSSYDYKTNTATGNDPTYQLRAKATSGQPLTATERAFLATQGIGGGAIGGSSDYRTRTNAQGLIEAYRDPQWRAPAVEIGDASTPPPMVAPPAGNPGVAAVPNGILTESTDMIPSTANPAQTPQAQGPNPLIPFYSGQSAGFDSGAAYARAGGATGLAPTDTGGTGNEGAIPGPPPITETTDLAGGPQAQTPGGGGAFGPGAPASGGSGMRGGSGGPFGFPRFQPTGYPSGRDPRRRDPRERDRFAPLTDLNL